MPMLTESGRLQSAGIVEKAAKRAHKRAKKLAAA